MASLRALSGARMALYLDGKLIGWAVGGSYSENRNLVAIDVLDDPWSQAFELVGITISGSISKVFIAGNDMGENGQYPNTINDKVQQINWPEGTLTFYDSLSKKSVASFYGVQFASRDGSITRDGVMMSNVAFRAIRMATETYEIV